MRNLITRTCLLLTFFALRSEAQTPPAMLNTIFPAGNKIQGGNFTGTVWVTPLLPADSTVNAAMGNVIFEPKARSNWHFHPGGQTLLALEGVGYYQEKDKPLQILRKGDVVRCPPNVEHWHGASHNNWFVQLAVTAEHPEGRVMWLHEVKEEEYAIGIAKQEEASGSLGNLEPRHQHIVAVASFTTRGDLEKLKKALNEALNAGLTVNELKEVLVHLYAYCGFPRSIQGLNTLMAVLENRKTQGITDETGKAASPIPDDLTKYERGKKTLEDLLGQSIVAPPVAGYGAFSPEIDVFLKEHLFADIFGRDVLSYRDREVATITALTCLGGVEPMLKGHLGIALNLGLTESQLDHLFEIIALTTEKQVADRGKEVFSEILEQKKK